MKKLLIVICLFILCGCNSDELVRLGYKPIEAKMIRSLDENNQAFFSSICDDFSKTLLNNENFDTSKLDTYLLFKDYFDIDTLLDLVNSEVINKDNYEDFKKVIDVEGFDVSKLKDYLKYLKWLNDDGVLTVEIVNAGLKNKTRIIRALTNDPMYVKDNLDLYLEYRREKGSIREVVEYVNTKRYIPYYEEQYDANIEKYGNLVLVNKYYYLDEDYEPDDLVSVESKYGIGRMRQEAYEAYKKMQDDANKEGINFYITSPYRSYKTQKNLYNSYLAKDSQKNVDIYSARPGSSEHQLGLAIDILANGYDFGNFEQSDAGKWLEKNAHKYGFILRYPASKIDITGYKYEPWHFRYLGDIAKDVYESGVTYEEYFEKFIRNNED